MATRRSGWSAKAYLVLRQAFGGTLLLGLEVLVAADLVRTVAVAPTLDNVLVLGLIVVIRTFLTESGSSSVARHSPYLLSQKTVHQGCCRRTQASRAASSGAGSLVMCAGPGGDERAGRGEQGQP